MAEYSANAAQVVNPGESVVFTESPVPCRRGFVRHRDGSGNFLLSGAIQNGIRRPCCGVQSVDYLVGFGANISIPTGGTPETISLAIAIDGSTEPETTMSVTPAAVEEPFNVSRSTNVKIWANCCETVTIRNTSDQPITVENANVTFVRR